MLPIACSLSSEGLTKRLVWIAELNGAHLREFRMDGSSLHLVYALDAARKVRELVQKERECCGFLRFALHESSDQVALRIDVPDVAETDTAPLFAPFLSGTSSVASTAAQPRGT